MVCGASFIALDENVFGASSFTRFWRFVVVACLVPRILFFLIVAVALLSFFKIQTPLLSFVVDSQKTRCSVWSSCRSRKHAKCWLTATVHKTVEIKSRWKHVLYVFFPVIEFHLHQASYIFFRFFLFSGCLKLFDWE